MREKQDDRFFKVIALCKRLRPREFKFTHEGVKGYIEFFEPSLSKNQMVFYAFRAKRHKKATFIDMELKDGLGMLRKVIRKTERGGGLLSQKIADKINKHKKIPGLQISLGSTS